MVSTGFCAIVPKVSPDPTAGLTSMSVLLILAVMAELVLTILEILSASVHWGSVEEDVTVSRVKMMLISHGVV